jgi:hypothetical protein
VTPGASERVGDQHGGSDPEQLTQAGPQRPGRPIGIGGEQDQRVVIGGIGGVDARVGAHEAVMGDGDQHPVGRATELARLVEHDLHVAGVLAEPGRKRDGPLAWRHGGQRAGPALGLGDELVRHHEHVVGRRRALGHRLGDQRRWILAPMDLGQALQRGGGDRRHRG